MNPYPETITDEISGVEVYNQKHDLWQEGYDTREVVTKELYEALKSIQEWLLEPYEIGGGQAEFANKQFVKANNLVVKVLAKAEL